MRVPFEGLLPELNFATLDLLPYGIIVTDRKGTVLFYNQREEEIAQRRRQDVVGRNFFTEIAPCLQVKQFQSRFDEAIGTDVVATFPFVFPFPDNPRAVEITLTGFEHQGTRLCMVTVNDKTEEDRVRAQILQAERFRELGEVAATVAHNFNNLLMVVHGNAELMLDSATSTEFKAQCLDILRAAQDGAQLVSRIRQTVTGERPADVPPILINEIVVASANAARLTIAKGTTIVVTTSSDVHSARVAPSELREVLLNLMRNAIDATSGRDGAAIHLATMLAGPRVRISVIDNGTGMSADVRRRLFQPLFTTKGAHGTGLGLASSLALMRRYEGTIDVETVEHIGSTIVIDLPHVIHEEP